MDGAIGQLTRDWLNVTSQRRAALIALNIQRLRLLPDKLDTGIMVNIPNYSLVYYLNGLMKRWLHTLSLGVRIAKPQ